MLEGRDLVATTRKTMCLHEIFRGILVKWDSLAELLYAQNQNASLKNFLESLFKISKYACPTEYLSDANYRKALKIVNQKRTFMTLKWSNAMARFFRGLSKVIGEFADRLNTQCSDLHVEDRRDWPAEKTLRLVDNSGALHIIDCSLLAEYGGDLDVYLEQLTACSSVYLKYSLRIGSILEHLVFTKSEYLFARSWDEMVFNHLERNYDWENPAFSLVSQNLRISVQTDLAKMQRQSLQKIKRRWKAAKSVSLLEKFGPPPFLFVGFFTPSPHRKEQPRRRS